MGIITSILGVFGGGWGTFAAVIAVGIFGMIGFKAYNKAKQDKAANDTKDKHATDKHKQTEQGQKQANDMKNDDEANEDAAKD